MKIVVVCSDEKHPIYPRLDRWRQGKSGKHDVSLVSNIVFANGGDILFLISCTEIVGPDVRNKFLHTLVIHASDLPFGRGWSPHVWQLLEGRNEITVSLIEATDPVDSGNIWAKERVSFNGTELFDEISSAIFDAELYLMDFALENYELIVPKQQDHSRATFYRRRSPEDSRIDVEQTLLSQFNLLRVCDPVRYPAFFEYEGVRYELFLKKAN